MRKKVLLVICLCLVLLVVCLLLRVIGACAMYPKIINSIRSNDMEQLKKDCSNPFSDVNYPYAFVDFKTSFFESVPVDFPLEVACGEGNAEAVKILLDYGAKPNKRHKFTITRDYSDCLKIAVSNGNTEITKILLDAGAESGNGFDLLFGFVTSHYYTADNSSNFFELYNLLEEHDLLSQNEDIRGQFLLNMAMANNADILDFLIVQKNFSLDYCNVEGQNALHICCKSGWQNGKKECVEYLLSQGVNPQTTDSYSKTAYDYAVEKGYTEITELLKP